MPGTELAKAYVQIVPSMEGMQNAIQTELSGPAEKAGKSSGGKFASAMAKGLAAGAVAVGTAAVALVKGVVDGAKSVAAYGDEIDKTSQKLGFSAEAYQQWDYVLNLSGTSMQSVSGGLKTLTNQLDAARSGSTEAEAMFAKLGLSLDDLNSMSREELFSSVIAGFQGMEESTERAALANDLFGRSGQELAPLFNTTAEATQEAIDKSTEYGMVMSDELVKASAAFVDSQTTLNNTLGGLKNRLLGEFLPALTLVTDGLAAFLAGDTSGLDTLQEGITGFIDQLSLELPKVLDFGVGVVEAIATGILQNAPQLLETATSTIMSLAQFLIQELPTILTVGIQLIIQLANGISTALPTLIPTIVQVVLELVNILIQNLPLILQAGVDILMALIQGIIASLPILIEQLPVIVTTIVNTLLESIDVIMETGVTLLTALIDAIPQMLPLLTEALPNIIETVITGLYEGLPLVLEGAISMFTAIVDAIPTIVESLAAALPQIIVAIIAALINSIPTILQSAIQCLIAIVQAIPTIVQMLIVNLPQIIKTIITSLIQAAPQILTSAKQALSQIGAAIPPLATQLWTSMKTVGLQLIQGLWNGISNAAAWIYSQISGFFSSVLSYIKGLFGIASPSKETEWMGKMLDYGLAGGIEDNMKPIQRAIDDVTDMTTGTLQNDLAVNAALGVSTDAQATSKLDQLIAAVAALGDKMASMQLVMDSGALVGATTTKYNQALGFDQALVARGVAR